MSLRVCMVTPYAWSQGHPVNDHVAGAAEELRRRGHDVVVLAPSNRAADLSAGRRALRRLSREGIPLAGTVALGPALPVSRRTGAALPLGVRANLELALTADSFDLVHAHDPALPSLSYFALRESRALTVATFHTAELAYPPGRKQRERLLARVDALTAVGESTLAAARERFPGDYRLLPAGIDTSLFRPERQRPRIVLDWRPEDSPRTRAALRALRALPEWELVLLRTKPLSGRPYVPLGLRARVRSSRAYDAPARARELAGAAAFIPALRGRRRLQLEAEAAGVPVLDPPGSAEQPQLVEAALARLAEDAQWRADLAEQARRRAEGEGLAALGDELERLYTSVVGRRRQPARIDPLAERPFVLCDLHLHTEHSYDCSVTVPDLLDYAEAQGLGAIAITDHNVFSGAEEALSLADDRPLTVIPGEEMKTADAGEVIGLFLTEEIPGGLTMAETLAAIRDQNGIVYLPHPFDRLHAVADARTLHRHLGEIDVFEVYNARLLFDANNDEALRFARKYNLTMGAGSDAHVLQGVGTGLVRMRAFETPEEFLISLRSAEIVRRPKSLVYLQGLKWMAQARERRARAAVQ
jgi:predicted metal-dependent phosphoesterase TrpH/glycosyltransferase involved in cell wall biosynthesis